MRAADLAPRPADLPERVSGREVQHNRDNGDLWALRALDQPIDRPRRLGLNPVAEPAKRAVYSASAAPMLAVSVSKVALRSVP